MSLSLFSCPITVVVVYLKSLNCWNCAFIINDAETWDPQNTVSLLYPLSYLATFILSFNPYHAKFLKWNNPSNIFGTVHYHFYGYQDENLKLVSRQYRAWLECTDVQAGLALYCWQRLITFDVGRIRG